LPVNVCRIGGLADLRAVSRDDFPTDVCGDGGLADPRTFLRDDLPADACDVGGLATLRTLSHDNLPDDVCGVGGLADPRTFLRDDLPADACGVGGLANLRTLSRDNLPVNVCGVGGLANLRTLARDLPADDCRLSSDSGLADSSKSGNSSHVWLGAKMPSNDFLATFLFGERLDDMRGHCKLPAIILGIRGLADIGDLSVDNFLFFLGVNLLATRFIPCLFTLQFFDDLLTNFVVP
jgi:hypothetical protein